MTIEEVIKKAIEGGYLKDKIDERGWIWEDFILENPHIKYGTPTLRKFDVFLDPQFWQCLGKTMGWENNEKFTEVCPVCDSNETLSGWGWQYQWHNFINHLAEGGTPESFFNQLK